MTQAVAMLLKSSLDYAGLFPPARLDMSAALTNFLAYREGPERALLARFCCPAGRLAELVVELGNEKTERAIPLTVLGHPSHDRHTWETAREADARAMNEFLNAADDRVEIEAFEVRVPDHLHLPRYLSELSGFSEVDVFVELPWADEMRESIALVAETDFAGVKARTGGTTAGDFPEPKTVAPFLHAALSAEVTFKLTAGLHHLFPTIDPETGARQHGLLSVLGGSALALANDLSVKELQSLLEAEPTAWHFGERIHFGDWVAQREDIVEARELFVSVGTCSIDEPFEELGSVPL